MDNDFSKDGYLLHHLPRADGIGLHFNSLTVDPYYGSYRYKAVSRFNFIDNKAVLLPHADFFQSKEYNPVAGDVVRSYPPIDKRTAESDFLVTLFEKISEYVDLTSASCLTAHQIRVVSTQGSAGLAAAEGIHQDGYDYIAMSCISRVNIVGGVTSLYTETKQKVFERELVSGDVLFVDDRRLFHYTTPIESLTPEKGHRDMLIITVSLSGVRDTPT